MSYMALYRKFRPESFEDVKGQEHIVKSLTNQIKSDRIGHAYLFCGTRGTGKTSVAKIVARAVNCENPQEGSPCNECKTCKSILSGASMNVIEIDAASNNGVDNIRDIREEVEYRPSQGKYKVYIIDEVHMLSTGAFNALLKTLEEPPEYVIFILATTEANKIPITILSRCQRYDFRRITVDTIANRLKELTQKENIEAQDTALRYIAKAADGSLRDSLSILDQCIAFCPDEMLTYEKVLSILGAVDVDIYARMLTSIYEGDVADTIHMLEKLIIEGKELTQFVTDFTWYLRNLLLIKTSDAAEDLMDVSAERYEAMVAQSQPMEAEILMRYIRVLSELSNRIRYASSKRVLVEVALIRLSQPQMQTDTDAVLDRVRVLERKMEEGVVTQIQTVVSSQEAVPKTAEKPVETPKPVRAAPEDLQHLMQNWQQITAASGGLLKQCIQNAVPKYNADANDAILYLECKDALLKGHLEKEEVKEQLQQIIEKCIGKSVQIEVLLAEEHQRAGLHKIPLDQVFEDNILMEVTVEENSESGIL
ncbi:MAG: DNA polymerase III subunit gamma/tau [Lachnospiraceae bacterium]